jgi:hypothetical protein
MKLPCLLSVLLFAAIVFGQESKPSAPESSSRPGVYDLRISGTPRALLVEVSQTAKGKITLKRNGQDFTQPIDWKYQVRWIDELGDFAARPLVDRRTFIEARKTDGGRTTDPGLEGITLVLTTTDEKRTAVPEGQRRMLKTELEKQLLQVYATGLFAALPQTAEVGASYELKAFALVATLLDFEGDLEGYKANVTLDRVDPKTNRAFLSGNVRFSAPSEKSGLSLVTAYSAAIDLEVDLEKKEMAKVTMKGIATISGRGDSEGSVSGEVSIDARGTTKPAGDVAALKPRNPTFRENTHQFAGMQFKLPSCWIVLAENASVRTFLDSRVEPDVMIEVALLDEEADPGSEAFIKGFTEAVRKADASAKVAKTAFPIGKGVSFETTNGEGLVTRGCIAPFGKVRARIRLQGSAAAVAKADSDLKVLMNSLKKASS